MTFQERVLPWMLECFGPTIPFDKIERGDRLIEEVIELLQSGAYPRERIAALTDYVYSREVGEPHQEAGGVMVTLAAYCLVHEIDMHQAGECELGRVWEKIDKIRAKQAAKPTGSALPIAVNEPPLSVSREDAIAFLEIAARNWRRMPKLSEDDLGDVATGLLSFLSARRKPLQVTTQRPSTSEHPADEAWGRYVAATSSEPHVEPSTAFAAWLNSGPAIAKAAGIEVEIVAITEKGGTLKLTSAGFPEESAPQTGVPDAISRPVTLAEISEALRDAMIASYPDFTQAVEAVLHEWEVMRNAIAAVVSYYTPVEDAEFFPEEAKQLAYLRAILKTLDRRIADA